jgi:[NiFe] hydrogenase diaphorase moiety large subunit
MLVSERERLSADILALADRYGRERTALLPILQAVRDRYHHISEFAMQEIAHLLGIHPVEVYGVVTFYSFLRERHLGRYVIRLCRTISCDMQGKDRIARQLETELGVAFGETTADGRFTLEWANCLGMCDRGPALLVNDEIYTGVTCAKVKEILDRCRFAFTSHAAEARPEENEHGR